MRLLVLFAIIFSASVQSFANTGVNDCDQRNAEAIVLLQGVIALKKQFEADQVSYSERMGAKQYTCAQEKLMSGLKGMEAYIVKTMSVYHVVAVDYCEHYKFTEMKNLIVTNLPLVDMDRIEWSKEITALEFLIDASDSERKQTCAVVEKPAVVTAPAQSVWSTLAEPTQQAPGFSILKK